MNSIDYPSPSQLLCPTIRLEKGRFSEIELGGRSCRIIDNSCYIADIREDQKFSQPHHLQVLLSCNNKEGKPNGFYCKACWQNTIGTIYYYCNDCDNHYHKECVESPAVFISPYHPKYPLQLLYFHNLYCDKECHSCGIRYVRLVYYSSICDLVLDPVCANKREFPIINNPKRHEHTLHYFPRRASLICDVCGLDDNNICFYICHQCNFVVHRTCVDLPRVIQISRHSHRLSFSSFLPSGNWSCGVCRQKIDGIYGEYSCSKGCAYAVHSKCGIRRDVWDGIELEDQQEKVSDHINSYEEIGDGIIRHFSHPHHNMRFDEDINEVYYERKHCEACVLPIHDGNVYRCMQCDFVLHEACANLPRIKHNMVHAHQYILQPGNSESFFFCDSCRRYSCGFRYQCSKGCNSLDVRCASLSEPVHHQSHTHPLFLVYTRKASEPCSICGELSDLLLNCVKCEFALCFRCATLPENAKHEDDEHLLILSYEKDAVCPYGCEVCEEKLDPMKGYYACSECGITLHIQCVLGKDLYMKPGQTIYIDPGLTRIKRGHSKADIIPNNRLIRPICIHCQKRCQYKIVFRTTSGYIFCSFSEVKEIIDWVLRMNNRRYGSLPPGSTPLLIGSIGRNY